MSTAGDAAAKPQVASPAAARRTWFARNVSDWRLLAMVLPATVAVILFDYIPIYGITFSIRELDFGKGIWFSPLADPWYRYFRFLGDPSFWQVMRNTVVIATAKLIFGFPAPIVLALFINEMRIKWFKRTTQTISYLPHFVSWVIISGLFDQLLSIDTGPVNQLLKAAIGEPIAFLGTPGLFAPMIVLTAIWQSVGWGTIIYLAVLSTIDTELYEAAIVDGAGRFRQVRHITLPGLVPTITILLVLAIPNITNAGFDQIYNFLNPIVIETGDVVQTYVVRLGLEQAKYSLTTAVGVFDSVISVVLVLTANTLSKRFGGSGIW